MGIESNVASVSKALADMSSRESVSAAEIQDVGRRGHPVTVHQCFDRRGSRELQRMPRDVPTKLAEVHAIDVFEVDDRAPYAQARYVPSLFSGKNRSGRAAGTLGASEFGTPWHSAGSAEADALSHLSRHQALGSRQRSVAGEHLKKWLVSRLRAEA